MKRQVVTIFSKNKKLKKYYTTPKLKKYEKMIVFKHIPKGSHILDACCGGGRAAIPLSKYYSVTGIDLDSVLIKKAREASKRNKRIKFINADIRTYRFRRKFDACIVLENSFEHIKNNYLIAFVNVSNALKEGGVLIFTAHSPLSIWALKFFLKGGVFNILKGGISLEGISFTTRDEIYFRILWPWSIYFIFIHLGFKLEKLYTLSELDKGMKLPFFIKLFSWYHIWILRKLKNNEQRTLKLKRMLE